jgi:hypothetical protein
MTFPASGVLQVQWLPTFLAVLLALPQNLSAQQPAGQPQQPNVLPAVQTLKILVLAGNGATNDLETGIMSPLVVQVLDQNSRPVEGAQVVFRFPLRGPGAEFPNQQTSQTARTNADGQAAAVGWVANKEAGPFQVQVSVSRGNELGSATVSMTNTSRVVSQSQVKPKKKTSKWVKIGIIAAIAAGVTVGVVLGTQGGGGGGGSNTTTVTASPGSPTIGGPH